MMQASGPGGLSLAIDLPSQTIEGGGLSFEFPIDPFRKQCLLQGADDIALALTHADRIRAYEKKAAVERPWCFERVVL
jgi:3-isopropylmalate/(R)-2-methylmalate dehydratase small subunit